MKEVKWEARVINVVIILAKRFLTSTGIEILMRSQGLLQSSLRENGVGLQANYLNVK